MVYDDSVNSFSRGTLPLAMCHCFANLYDPYVRVLGTPDGVSEACGRIRQDLQPHPKIIMKMDVPWTAHSHIIGRGGNTIQLVVKRTGVSIHFPDGNKNSGLHKSNHVSINSRGSQVSGLEEARRAIRDLTPLVFSFTLPAGAQFVSPTTNAALIVQNVQNVYNVQAELKVLNENTIFGTVRGTDWDATRVKEATLCLLHSLCGSLANQMMVQLTMEVSPQHHQLILGRDSQNIKKIMQRTSTKVIFPDVNDPMLAPLKRSTITIMGGIKNVYMARQNIIGSLPIVLLFDLNPGSTLDHKEIIQLTQSLDVAIVVKNPRVDGVRNVTVRACERDVSKVYETWKILTKSLKTLPKATIPPEYRLSPSNNVLSSFPLVGCNWRRIDPPNQVLPEINNNFPIKSLSPIGSVDEFPEPFSGNNSISLDDKSLLTLLPDRRAPGCEKQQGLFADYTTKKMLAAKYMQQPIVPDEPRTPTDIWSGYGLSKSQPAHVLINQLKYDQQNQRDLWPINSMCSDDRVTTNTEYDDNLFGQTRQSCIKSTSTLFDSTPLRPPIPSPCPKDVFSILISCELTEYIDLFVRNGIDFSSFCKLTDQDLQDIGVVTWLHRMKLLAVIKTLSTEFHSPIMKNGL